MCIRKCPDCAAYSHIDNIADAAPCWNCGCFTDYSSFHTPVQKIINLLDAFAGALFIAPLRRIVNHATPIGKLPANSRMSAVSRVALIVALPIALLYLVACTTAWTFPLGILDCTRQSGCHSCQVD